MRIGIGGFQHETNSFAAANATLDDFLQPDAWPGLLRGSEIFDAVAGINIPIAGFIDEAKSLGHELVPLLWCSASPSAEVTEDAFETIYRWLAEEIAAALPVDALYLDLHGAMVTRHLEDGEGELLKRLRGLLGSSFPIVASLDFHANITAAMIKHVTAMLSYRTYPHVDMADTGARAARLFDSLTGSNPEVAVRKLPYLIPLVWQSSLAEPMNGLMARAAELENLSDIISVSFAPGFPLADIAECGPAILVYAMTAEAAGKVADLLYDEAVSAERAFTGTLYPPEEAVRRAIARPGKVILADTQDNPGAGGSSDTVGLLRALIEQGARNAVLAVLCDPIAAAAAHEAGEGAVIDIALGARSGLPPEDPVRGTFRVGALGDGKFTGTGPFYGGCHMQLGPMARLERDGVSIVVSSRRQQAADQAMLRHVGIEPAEAKILALKSSVHFRADFANLASEILIVAAPGANIADPEHLAYRRLRPGLRIGPMGPAFANKIARLEVTHVTSDS